MSAEQTKPEVPAATKLQRRFVPALLAVCAVGVVLRALMLGEFLLRNPIAESPIGDGWVYWRWAGRIAEGQILGETPFLSAPLYPYFLGLLRAMGLGLTGVYVMQLVMHVGTGLLIGLIARRVFGAAAGVLAVVLFLLLADPAFDSTRILASTLQLLLISALLGQLVLAREAEKLGRWGLAGLLLGLFCLAYPAGVLLIPGLGVWLWWRKEKPARKAGPAAVVVITACVVIAPATWHNWRATGGEFIPITAHSGITFLQGNTPEARGMYRAVPGISRARELMHYDAAAVYQQATGKAGSWGQIDRFYRNQGLAFWRDHPAQALWLISKRIYLFFTARYYNEIHWPAIEMRRSVGRLQWLAPLPTPWVLGLAAWGLLTIRKDVRRHGAEWALFLLPLLVVAVFFYSPRYRMVVLPVAVVLAARVVLGVLRRGAGVGPPELSRRWSIAAVGLLVAGMVTGPVNARLGIDHPMQDNGAYDFNLGVCLARQGQTEQAIEHLRRAVETNPRLFEARFNLGMTFARDGRPADAEREYRRALETEPGYWPARKGLAQALAAQDRFGEAVEEYRMLLEQRPGDAGAHHELGILYERQGDLELAEEHYLRAVRLAPEVELFHESLARLTRRGDGT
ncbi:MAG: tetratricopeptide repeat protein [Phycisphaerales bacterium]|nr:MAG: tetratricopeptide repeat protein [Phycisphaerales bacterium]